MRKRGTRGLPRVDRLASLCEASVACYDASVRRGDSSAIGGAGSRVVRLKGAFDAELALTVGDAFDVFLV